MSRPTSPDPTSRPVAVVTGATSGLGLVSARALAGRGFRVVLAVRDVTRGHATAGSLQEGLPGATFQVEALDLADLASVRAFGERVPPTLDRLDVLLNNAGVMMPPQRRLSADGFELQFATNHLGHAALTGHLLPLLRRSPGARVVTVSSLAARGAAIRFDDLRWDRDYDRRRAYGMSKLANLLFTRELDRRLRAAGADVLAVAAHPGVAATNLVASMELPGLAERVAGAILPSAEQGAVAQVSAATAPGVEGGTFWGPGGWGQLTGSRARVVDLPAAATSDDTARRLWDVTATLTGVDVVPG